MKRTLTSECSSKIGEVVQISGWLYNLRALGKIAFLLLRDRGGIIQVVLEDSELINKVKSIQNGSILEITGNVKSAPNTQLKVEIENPQIQIVNPVLEPFSIDLTKADINAELDVVLDYRPLTLRHPKSQAIFKIQAGIVRYYREFLTQKGFTEFFGPNVISASSEGGAELFTVNYFDTKAMLSQSAQLYKQMMVGVHERVFALMKCFRAEKSATRRHLTEATQFEMEMGFIADHNDIMDVLEEAIKFISEKIALNYKSELELLGITLPDAEKKFPRVTFKDALQIYFERTGIDERSEIDLSPNAEKELCLYAKEKFGVDYIFVEKFLRIKTAFYAKPNEVDPTVTNYFDLLCRECEIVSGGQRINSYKELVDSLKLKGLNPLDFEDYLSIFKYGMPSHGGFGMGMERLTMMMLGLNNIREATLFPSDLKRIAAKSINQAH